MRRMRCAISIPQFYSDGQFNPAAFRAYFARAEELGFDSAWAQEQVLGSAPQLGPVETMTYAAACTQGLRPGARGAGGPRRAALSRARAPPPPGRPPAGPGWAGRRSPIRAGGRRIS